MLYVQRQIYSAQTKHINSVMYVPVLNSESCHDRNMISTVKTPSRTNTFLLVLALLTRLHSAKHFLDFS